MPEPQVFGPYETEQETYDSPLCLATLGEGLPGSYTELEREHLRRACADFGVTLGAYDARIVDWIGLWEPQVVQVVIGLISRSYAAGRAQSSGGETR